MQEQALGSHSHDLESQVAALNRASLLPLDAEDTRKARDAIIVAIGISSVLVINVAYLGYITPPGGSNPYWADCFYAVFFTYFALNGFALVFSIAALCAVTWGPFILIRRAVSNWRTRVVNLGLTHLALSLTSLLGAFLCAGLVTASVGAPALTCGNLICTEGGVACSAFGVRPAALHRYSGGNWTSYTHVLSPTLAKLNKADFTVGDATQTKSTGAEVDGQDVTCMSYSHIATFSDLGGNMPGKPGKPTPFDGRHGDGVLDDAFGRPINTTCLVLVDLSIFSPTSGISGYTYTSWCSSNASTLGPGWLPIRWEVGGRLLESALPGYNQTHGHYHTTTDGYAVEGPHNGGATCPDIPGFKDLIQPLGISLPGLKPRGVQSLTDWESGSVYESSGPCTFSGEAARRYANVLGGSCDNSRHDCPATYRQSQCDSNSGSTGALGNAINYHSLRYRCSEEKHGVLCDYGVYPHLSVDAEGGLLDKKALSQLSDAAFFSAFQNRSAAYAVYTLIVVAFVVITGTFSWLGWGVTHAVAYKGLY